VLVFLIFVVVFIVSTDERLTHSRNDPGLQSIRHDISLYSLTYINWAEKFSSEIGMSGVVAFFVVNVCVFYVHYFVRLKEYPQYCQYLASIQHFAEFPPNLKEVRR